MDYIQSNSMLFDGEQLVAIVSMRCLKIVQDWLPHSLAENILAGKTESENKRCKNDVASTK